MLDYGNCISQKSIIFDAVDEALRKEIGFIHWYFGEHQTDPSYLNDWYVNRDKKKVDTEQMKAAFERCVGVLYVAYHADVIDIKELDMLQNILRQTTKRIYGEIYENN